MIIEMKQNRQTLTVKADGFPTKTYNWLTPQKATDRYCREVGIRKSEGVMVIIKSA